MLRDISTDPIVKVNCNVSPVVISQLDIVEKGQSTLHDGDVLSTEEFLLELLATELQFQLSHHDIKSWLGEKVARIFFICIHGLVGREVMAACNLIITT